MKYCLSNRQPKSLLKNCDEIKFEYRDIEDLYNFAIIDEFKEKVFILDIPSNIEADWTKITNLCKEINLMVCLHAAAHFEIAHDLHVPWYWAYPAANWQDFNSLIQLKPAYIFITAPISMSLKTAKKMTDIPFRMVPNIAYDAYLPRHEGIQGQWVRPEDVGAYGKYVDVFEFVAPLRQEATLFHVYAENGQWPGNLNLLLTNLGFDIDNRTIPNDLISTRMNCGQRCMSGGRCNLCRRVFDVLEMVRANQKELREKMEN